MELDYFVVDVFTETALAGNPLAVVMNTANLTAERMQEIAREFNLSETTSIQRRPAEAEQAEGVRVRIFTTQEELPFAGHPTLGTASVLKLFAPETMHSGVVKLALSVGSVPVRFEGEGLFGEMTQRDPEFGAELNAKEVARLTGLTGVDLDPRLPPQVVSTGTAFAIVPLRSQEALARLNVNRQEAPQWLRERGARMASPHAVQRRRGSGHGIGGGVRHWLPGLPGCGGAGRTHHLAARRGDRPAERIVSLRADPRRACTGTIGAGYRCAGGGQHRSCGKRTAFPAVMHMLSTGIHNCK
jgi:trans-2,3-dihydro-3-hydroxyanthranilate isomerase